MNTHSNYCPACRSDRVGQQPAVQKWKLAKKLACLDPDPLAFDAATHNQQRCFRCMNFRLRQKRAAGRSPVIVGRKRDFLRRLVKPGMPFEVWTE